jgi:SWI/SNF-related matrix-associated actin-dependent regulator 1 of chromatin subfamily A
MKSKTIISNHYRMARLAHFKMTEGEVIKITFPFNREDLERVRSLEGRKFHNENGKKYWSAPMSVSNVEKLIEWEFSIDPELMKYYNRNRIDIDMVKYIGVPGLKGKLYPFQNKGVAFIEQKNGRALIADEMGLGKTIQALAWLQLHKELRPVIVVCPASLKLNWEREIHKWMNDYYRTNLLSGKNSIPLSKHLQDIFIINYDILPEWINQFVKIDPQVLIIDEIHYIKNNKAKRTRAVKQLSKNVPHVIGLSGTPIINRPIEAYNACKIIDSQCLPNYFEYTERYCGRHYNGFGWDVSGATNTEELNGRLTHTIMIRRRKQDVLPELPDKTYSYVPITLDNINKYKKAENHFIQFIRLTKGKEKAERASNAQALTEIEVLKQLTIEGKIKQAGDWIEDFLASDQKLVIFCTHRLATNTLIERFKDCAVKIDGSVTGAKRQEAVDQFQNNPAIRLFVGNVKAAGVGITLTAASNVAFLELPWTPGEVSQAEDRCHRIGQKDAVNVYFLLAEDTIEEKIIRLLDKKKQILSQVLDGTSVEESSLLTELIESYYG